MLLTLKKWLSYFTEIHIESAPSAFNPHLYVSLSKGRFQLSTDRAIYSFEDLYANFANCFRCVDWTKYQPKKILILGGGLLSVPYLLEKYIQEAHPIDIVEIDDQVIYLAQKYIQHKLRFPIHWHHDTAESFMMQRQTSSYDLIIIDVFDSDKIPETIDSPYFLECVSNCINPDGLVLMNRLSRLGADVQSSKRYLERVFKPCFNDGGYLDVEGNYILANHDRFWRSGTTFVR